MTREDFDKVTRHHRLDERGGLKWFSETSEDDLCEMFALIFGVIEDPEAPRESVTMARLALLGLRGLVLLAERTRDAN